MHPGYMRCRSLQGGRYHHRLGALDPYLVLLDRADELIPMPRIASCLKALGLLPIEMKQAIDRFDVARIMRPPTGRAHRASPPANLECLRRVELLGTREGPEAQVVLGGDNVALSHVYHPHQQVPEPRLLNARVTSAAQVRVDTL